MEWKRKALASKEREERAIELEKHGRADLEKERKTWDGERVRLRDALRTAAAKHDEVVAELETALAAKSAESIEVQADSLSLLTAAKAKIAELQQVQAAAKQTILRVARELMQVAETMGRD